MRFTSIFLFIFLLSLSINVGAQINFDQRVVVESKEVVFEDLISIVESQTNVKFSYSSAVVSPFQQVQLLEYQFSLSELLQELESKLDISYVEFNGKILFVEKKAEWKEFWIYGYVRDQSSHEPLIGAVVYNEKDRVGTETNEFGYFSLKIRSPESGVYVSFLGYQKYYISDYKQGDNRIDIGLIPRFRIPTIIVTPIDSIDNRYYMQDIFKSVQKSVNPSLFGEKDVLQSIKYLPGIQSGSEIQGNVLVRGGGSDQNLFLMDGVPVYEVNHLLGLTSIFNEDAINNVNVSTSDFSSKYGGRLSSVIDVQVKDGNKLRHHGSVSVGLLGAKVHLEGPLVKGKTSYNASTRTSYINAFIQPLAERFLNINKTKFGYSDLNLKIHHQLTKNNSIALSTYQGRDVLGFQSTIDNIEHQDTPFLISDNRVGWSNGIVNFRFNQIINNKLFFNFSASTSDYKLNTRSSNTYNNYDEFGILETDELDVFANSQIIDRNVRIDWQYKESNAHTVLFGGGITKHAYNPTVISEVFISTTSTPNPALSILADERFIYLEDQYDLSRYFSFTAGMHLSQFLVEDEEFTSFQPRLTLKLFFDPTNDLSISYSKMTQFVHLLINPGTGLPSDLWLPSTKVIPPEESIQYSIKYSRIWNREVLTSLSAYYKSQKNLIEYRSAFPLYNPVINERTVIRIFENPRDWEDRVEVGTGEAYGLDFFTSYTAKKWKNTFGYSLSYSNRTFENINKGETFPFKYDRRHDLSVSSTYRHNDRWSFGLNWIYGSGYATTFSTTQFISIEGEPIFDNGERNAFRLPAYNRLDLNIQYTRPLFGNTDLKSSLGLYNAYNRLNPYYVYLYNDEQSGEFKARQVGIFPLLPFVNISLQF